MFALLYVSCRSPACEPHSIFKYVFPGFDGIGQRSNRNACRDFDRLSNRREIRWVEMGTPVHPAGPCSECREEDQGALPGSLKWPDPTTQKSFEREGTLVKI